MDMDTLQWSSPEYEEKNRSRDWFWALGVIVVCGSAAAIIYADYFFAALIILSGLLLGYFAMRKPQMISYEIGPRGLRVDKRLYPYDTMKGFCVQIEPKGLLLVHSEGYLMPILSIPVPDDMAENIYEAILSRNVPEEKLQPHHSETIMDALGF